VFAAKMTSASPFSARMPAARAASKKSPRTRTPPVRGDRRDGAGRLDTEVGGTRLRRPHAASAPVIAAQLDDENRPCPRCRGRTWAARSKCAPHDGRSRGVVRISLVEHQLTRGPLPSAATIEHDEQIPTASRKKNSSRDFRRQPETRRTGAACRSRANSCRRAVADTTGGASAFLPLISVVGVVGGRPGQHGRPREHAVQAGDHGGGPGH